MSNLAQPFHSVKPPPSNNIGIPSSEAILLAAGYPPPPDLEDGLTAWERMRRSPTWARIVAETGGDDEHRD